MSARVVRGIAPAGKPHPATKWSLLMALLVVVVLVVPGVASAGQPTVQAPTGPQSSGVFTGVYTFGTYISCSGGPSFNSSYSNNLDGTHTFAFYGAADGSLLVTIDSSGYMLVTSCGSPGGTPITNVANYTVTKGTPPPPTPTPTATPTPSNHPTTTPTPPAGGGGTKGGSGSAKGGAASSSPPPGGASSTPSAGASATPIPGSASSSANPPSSPTGAASRAAASKQDLAATTTRSAGHPRSLLWPGIIAAAALIVALLVVVSRSRRLRAGVHTTLMPLRLRLEPYWFRLHHLRRHVPTPRGRDEPKTRGLSPHHHSGRLLAHHHTSYPALVFLVLVSAVLAAAVSYASRADSSSSSMVSLTVSGPPPTQAASIDDPTDGQHFATNTITVRGSCPSGLLIEIYRNAVFAGASVCDANDLYAVLVTLVPNENDLVAKDSDALGQYGPDSSTVQAFYDAPPPPPSPSPAPSATPRAPVGHQGTTTKSPSPTKLTPTPLPTPPPLLLTTSRHLYQGIEVGDQIEWPVTISNGHAPYRVTWEWGDSSRDSSLMAFNAGAVQMEHQYTKAGSYQVTIRVRDSTGAQAVIQVVTIVNGTATATTAIGASRPESGGLIAVWPLLSMCGLVVASFWLGEHHKLAIFRPLAHPVGY